MTKISKPQIILAQINSLVGDLKGNTKKIISIIKKNQTKNSLIIFPELAIWGYPPKDLLFNTSLIEENFLAIKKITEAIDLETTVIVGAVDKIKNNLYNTAFILEHHKIKKKIYKVLLPNWDVFNELRYFHIPINFFSSFSLANNLITWQNKKILLTICADIWPARPPYSHSPFSTLALKKIDLIINISASPFFKEKVAIRKKVACSFKKGIDAPLIYLNSVGAHDDLIFDGNSFVLNKKGDMIKKLPAFQKVIAPLTFPINEAPLAKPLSKDQQEEIFSAIRLGLREYLVKNNFKKVIIGLSGGIDSALVASLAALILGSKKVILVLLPSQYTSKESLEDANELAKKLKINPLTISIEEKVDLIRKELPKIKSLTDENLQARMRGLMLMTLSNEEGALLLATSNKSELAMGYGTLYGDLAGGLNIIGDLFKTEVYALANWINQKKNIIPSNILTKEPTAELKANQKDSDTLPPYEVLDKILNAAIVQQKSFREIKKLGFPQKLVQEVMYKIKINEYKRYQSPPILKLSEKAFGPGRIIPLTQK